jgi:multiple sugar transport system substrate-binding protein
MNRYRTRCSMWFVLILWGFILSASLAGTLNEARAQGSGPTGTITWMTMPAGTQDKAYIAGALERFAKLRPGIKVNVEVISWNDTLNKMVTAVASGTGPDVVQLYTGRTSQLYATDAFVDLTPRIAEFGGRDAYFPGAMHYGVYNGRVYGIPWGGDSRAYYYRPDRLQKAGIAAPNNKWTWDDMIRILQKLKGVDGVEFPFLMYGAPGNDVARFFVYTLWSKGGDWVDKDLKRVTFNDEIGQRTVRDIVDLMMKYKVMSPSMAELGQAEMYSAFYSGSASIIPGPTNVAVTAETQKIPIGAITPPRDAAGHFGAFISISVFSIPKYSPNQAAAFEFLKFLTSRDEEAAYNKAVGWLPARIDAWADDYFKTGWRAPIRYGMENGRAWPQLAKMTNIETALGQHLNNIYVSVAKKTFSNEVIKRELDQAAAEIQEMLK